MTKIPLWLFYALGSAVMAALTSILAKIGIAGVNSNLATAIRTTVVLFLSWIIVLVLGLQNQTLTLTPRNWIFLILSGFATGASWLLFYRALQLTDGVTKVLALDKLSLVIAMILSVFLLHEKVSWQNIIGVLLIVGGTFLTIL